MAITSLNKLRRLRVAITGVRRWWLTRRHGVRYDASSSLSLSARFICVAPGAIEVGAESLVAFKTLLLSRIRPDGTIAGVRVGRRCFIGGGSMILPGVSIGDESIVAAGAVVDADVPARSIVAGNPARVIRRDIVVGRFGRLEGADETSRRLWQP